IEGVGMLSIWFSIHGTLGMDVQDELAFSAFHSISAFCNAGFSTLPGNNLEEERLTGIRAVFSLTDFRCLHQRDGETVQKFLKHIDQYMTDTYPKGFRKEDVLYTTLSNDKVMLLNYTSGTTGFSKGVMLTGNNLAGNVTFGIRTELLKKGDKVLSFLPLAHAYGCAFDFLTATAVGTHVTLLGKVPSPKIIMKAFEEVKPNLIITVPLVIEKIYKNVI
ncbi:AMP-binding protein, partial [Bacteroides fragilis]|uniref:AMP-binding protein n=1 Tax=Bacteroides fragilis TaxID=817 RepID=UPI000AC008F9